MTSHTLSFIIAVLAFFGILFIGVFIHEVFHFLHGEGATAVCLTTNAKANSSIQQGPFLAYTEYDLSQYSGIEEFNSFMELTEKYVWFVGCGWNIALGVLLGFWIRDKKHERETKNV